MVRGKKKSSVHEYEGFFFNGEKVTGDNLLIIKTLHDKIKILRDRRWS